ncbi:MAG: hypothetical protein J0I57_07035 [Hyphomicrobium sp.]|jgi:hypothetical protein|nr:hypothetical protein [Hyphomicrobium sp.]MBN9264661.1 hypothetical protein [Hyphomicrobium sp.]MBN9277376.1 hypothetical protein [Hyphomicrobium sp.]
MPAANALLEHWYFHVPNLVLAALMYLMALYFVTMLAFGWSMHAQGAFLRVFHGVVNPVLRTVRVLTPHIVPNGLVPALAVVWLAVLRVLLYWGFLAAGIRPKIGA